MSARPTDPQLVYHWLSWRVRCFEAQGVEFQTLFENVMERVHPGFIRIRPYGNIGDRKSDGLCLDGTLYAVYSPDELTQAELIHKIEEDLSGAWRHWGAHGLKRWVFVYNVRRGLPPDVGQLLMDRQSSYPTLTLETLHSGDLWRMVSQMSPQIRSELLGLTSESAAADNGVLVVLHDMMRPIQLEEVLPALGTRPTLGPPLRLSPSFGEDWKAAAALQRSFVEDLLQQTQLNLRLTVFSLSPVSLVIHLGFLLSDRVRVEPFQYDRDRLTWCWPEPSPPKAPVTTRQISHSGRRGAAILRVSLSGHISSADTCAHVPEPALEIDLAIESPDVVWLTSPGQLLEITRAMRDALQACLEHGGIDEIHLFAAVPTGVALRLGQAINPRMCPPVQLYEFSMQRAPRYRRSLLLTDTPEFG